MGEVGNPWPNFLKPATKGDIVNALVAVHSAVVDIALALSAADRGDETTAKSRVADLQESAR
jgi:hypothetical protein